MSCGIYYRDPMPTEEQLVQYYQTEYRTPDYPSLHDRVVQLTRAERLLAYCDYLEIKPETALDYGCANGVLLEEARKKWGCRVMGVELNPLDREIAAERGVDVKADISEVGDGFDVVFMAHVLEHLREPVEFLVGLKERLVPGAWVVLEMPHPRMAGCWAPFHMTAWPPGLIHQVFSHSGYIHRETSNQEMFGIYHAVAKRP